jgi:hypothetical protein
MAAVVNAELDALEPGCVTAVVGGSVCARTHPAGVLTAMA